MAGEHEALCQEIESAYGQVQEIADLRQFSRKAKEWWCGWVLLILHKQPFRSAREYLALCPSRDYWTVRSQYAQSVAAPPDHRTPN